ncbi:MAG: hypothetical protein R3C99_09110 [Pirellulaceae bacterium]
MQVVQTVARIVQQRLRFIWWEVRDLAAAIRVRSANDIGDESA